VASSAVVNTARKLGRSRGAFLLAQVGERQKEIADRVGCNRVEISYYASGERKPGAVNRRKFASLFAIPFESWDEPIEETAPAVVVEAPPAALPWLASGAPTRALEAYALRLQGELDTLLKTVLANPTGTPREKMQAISAAAETMKRLGYITGETLEIPPSKLRRLPMWRRMEDLIVHTLEPWPDAMRALAEAFNNFDE